MKKEKADAVMVFPNHSRVAVYGGPLLVEYTFIQGVLHFGTGSGQGAEHHIDEQNNVAEETETNNSDLAGFMKAVRELHAPGANGTSPKETAAVSKFFMSFFTPSSTENYYLYSGSLTFPPCTERVINVVLSRSVHIGKDQLAELRKLKWRLLTQPCSSATVAGNVRKLVPSTTGAETRAVYRNFRFMTRMGATRTAHAAPSVAALVVISVTLSVAAPNVNGGSTWRLL
ncbi:hypothetical protein V5799_009733 [Amblyomma americanum]|uniref:carbonic anhydrase n=1 Tax=Amblyomma americanum TaxID=6943 RepID=A0AAQ4FA14_AMBAM